MADLDSTKNAINKLVEKYNTLEKEGRIKDYNEEMTKKDFILPLFKALGWDTENSKEVSAEEAIKNKRVDYGFKIDGIPKFFLEAKSLKDEDIINLKYVQQAIDYAWMKSCRWAVLTNFRTLVIYNAEERNKDPRLNRFLIFTSPEDYLKDDKIYLLSKESFEKGELNKQAVEVGKAELKKPVDKALLDDITNFRELLYNSIKKNNTSKGLNEEDIEEAVQRIIDRMIFIRSAEDRGLEPEELRSKIREWSNNKSKLLEKLSDLYKEYDDNYNSKLFALHLCDDLKIDDDVLNTVINGLYESKDGLYRYDFSLLSADILGNIYEQYLGRILKKVGKNSKLEASKTKRKSEGIYYTPTYIVDYIVKNTVGEYIKTHKEKDIDNIKILDPACGSGSFLLKAYDTLENYWKEKSKLDETKLEEFGSYSKKVDIVTKNIFGVDLDEKAVEITQLNLLLKIAEKRKRLPKLQENIKNGNSLIDDEKVSDKAFNWNEEFKDIMKNGGFDIVIGNPPYISVKALQKADKIYFIKNYLSAKGQFDLYELFIEKSIDMLKENGLFSFITSNTFLSNKDFVSLRQIILANTKILQIIDLRETVFQDANLDVSIIVLQKCRIKENRENNIILVAETPNKFKARKFEKIRQNSFDKEDNYNFKIHENLENSKLLKKIIDNSLKLGEIVTITRGIEKGSNECIPTEKKPTNNYVPILVGKDINRYHIHFSNRHIKYQYNNKSDFKTKEIFERPKILVQRIRNLSLKRRLISTLDENNYYTMNTLRIIYIKNNKYDLRYILALLNSSLINYYFAKSFNNKDIYAYQLEKIPIKLAEQKEQSKIKSLVDKILLLNQKIESLHNKNTNENKKIEGEIIKIDKEIDDLVYKIYGITDEEKKIIEESLK